MSKKKKGGRVTAPKVDNTWTLPSGIEDRFDAEYILPIHSCEPRKSGNLPYPHLVPSGTEWECKCGKIWRITKNHVGKNCGCGWALSER